MQGLPQRGTGVANLGLPVPPTATPRLLSAGRMLKRWRYVGVYGPELMLCVGDARIGPLPQRWWAIAAPDRPLRERTSVGRGGVELTAERVRVEASEAQIDLALTADPASDVVEVASPAGASWIWTRKQVGVRARGRVSVGGRSYEIDGEAFIDESAGYHDRVTAWQWSAGLGRGTGGERVAWNVVAGIHDAPKDSERAVWVDGRAVEVGPVRFADDLARIEFDEGGGLDVEEWSARSQRTNLLLFRNSYRQPFGTFAGRLPGGVELAEGYGVTETHDVRW